MRSDNHQLPYGRHGHHGRHGHGSHVGHVGHVSHVGHVVRGGRGGQDRTKLTFKLDFPDTLYLADFAILAML